MNRGASARLIRRFVDPKAIFLFVGPKEAVPRGATPFDLPSVELGHRNGRVTFDALLVKYATECLRKDRALARMAEAVRDIDLAAFRLPDSRGLELILYGLLLSEPDDGQVLLKANPIFEGIHHYYHGDQAH